MVTLNNTQFTTFLVIVKLQLDISLKIKSETLTLKSNLMEPKKLIYSQIYLKFLWTLKSCGSHISEEHFHVFWCNFALVAATAQMGKIRHQMFKDTWAANSKLIFERLLKTLRNTLFTHSSLSLSLGGPVTLLILQW